jgi:hypothetical protein
MERQLRKEREKDEKGWVRRGCSNAICLAVIFIFVEKLFTFLDAHNRPWITF